MNFLAKWTLAHGGKTLCLQVMAENVGARKLYEMAGFTKQYDYHYQAAGHNQDFRAPSWLNSIWQRRLTFLFRRPAGFSGRCLSRREATVVYIEAESGGIKIAVKPFDRFFVHLVCRVAQPLSTHW